MYFSELSLSNFKNHKQLILTFDPNLNVIIGRNGIGKTNILDALHLLCCCKSGFGYKDSHCITFGMDNALVSGILNTAHKIEMIRCQLTTQSKKMSWDNLVYPKITEHLGKILMVLVTPEDSALVREDSSKRRKWADGGLVQLFPQYLSDLLRYQRLLIQKNSHLKNTIIDFALLDIYDEQLRTIGLRMYQQRLQFIKEVEPIILKYYLSIIKNSSESSLQIKVQYKSDYDNILAYRQNDLRYKNATFGAHKDDFEILIQGVSAKRFSSQGQIKTIALSMKLALYNYLYQHKKQKPILLLDDIGDKLDQQRLATLIEIISTLKTQTIMTTTNKDLVNVSSSHIIQLE